MGMPGRDREGVIRALKPGQGVVPPSREGRTVVAEERQSKDPAKCLGAKIQETLRNQLLSAPLVPAHGRKGQADF